MRNVVFNPCDGVVCVGCGVNVKGIQRFCKICGKGILCYVCWMKSGEKCSCGKVDIELPSCPDCIEDTAEISGSEMVLDATSKAIVVFEEACADYLLQPAIGVVGISGAIAVGLVGGIFAVAMYPLEAAYKECVQSMS